MTEEKNEEGLTIDKKTMDVLVANINNKKNVLKILKILSDELHKNPACPAEALSYWG